MSYSSPSPLLFYRLLSFLAPLLFLALASSPSSFNSATSISDTADSKKPPTSTHHHQICFHEHFSVLLRLKKGFVFRAGVSKTNLSTWDVGNRDCCSWEGITCNTSTGHVIGLNVSDLFIAGVFDFGTLFHLQSLQLLGLSNTFFDPFQIPSSFQLLTGLTHLHLAGSGFYSQILPHVSHLRRLVSLDLAYCQYCNGSDCASLSVGNPGLKTIFQNLSSLRELHLDRVNMSTEGSQWSQAFYFLPSLRILSMTECSLSGPILPFFSHLRFLTYLDLSSNNLSSPVPDFISNFSSLTTLVLSDSGLHGNIPNVIFNLPKIQTIDISGNPLLTGSLPEFSPNSTIQQLLMAGTDFHGKMPDSMGNLKMLVVLSISHCSLSGSIPQSLVNLTQLVFLDLAGNSFTGQIPSGLFSLPSLQRLMLFTNHFSGELGGFQNASSSPFQYIYLSENNLQGYVPSSLFQLPQLSVLELNSNSFSSIEFQNVSSSRLIVLFLQNNIFQGSIPRIIFQLTRLLVLDLSSNNLGGVIDIGLLVNHKNLSNLYFSSNSWTAIIDSRSNSTSMSFPSLSSLHLSSCNIDKFPEVLRNMYEMQDLDLSFNKISGKIPEWIWKVGNGSLVNLNLSHNALEGLEGSFPHLSLSSMINLDLSFNRLRGSTLIPPPSTHFFSLSNNAFDTEISILICDAKSLEVLDLSNNHFTGLIPQCLSKLSNTLTVLDFHKNNFHGPLLQTFTEGCTLETFDLSDNQFEGEMPRSLANCQNLTVLNLGNNQIQDTFPSWLANLLNLRVLVLRANKFHGFIEQPSTGQVYFPKLQIIDLSSNSFVGSLPANLFSSWKAMIEGGSASRFLATYLLNGAYYQDQVMIVSKGIETEYVKILDAFVAVDLSHNEFHGNIPNSVGELKSLHVLNMSRNHFEGEIPVFLENLRDLESLDFSQNSLSGNIPWQLTKLSFLEVLNLSQNQLTGTIPRGGQFETFNSESFLGNLELCGPPLPKTCKEETVSTPTKRPHSKSELDFMWIGFGVGYGVGVGIFFWTLALWREGRRKFFIFFDRMLLSFLIFATLHLQR